MDPVLGRLGQQQLGEMSGGEKDGRQESQYLCRERVWKERKMEAKGKMCKKGNVTRKIKKKEIKLKTKAKDGQCKKGNGVKRTGLT